MQNDTATLTFGVYDDHDGPFAVLNDPGPDTPVGTLEAVQDAVDDRPDDFDGAVDVAGTVEYVPGKDDGEVVDVRFGGDA